MTGLNIKICTWCLDPSIEDEIKQILNKGNIVAKFDNCIEGSVLAEKLSKDQPDLVIADFDAPKSAREIVEREMEPYYTEVPLIYLVREDTQHQATEALKTGLWDYVNKEQLFMLIPSVISSLASLHSVTAYG